MFVIFINHIWWAAENQESFRLKHGSRSRAFVNFGVTLGVTFFVISAAWLIYGSIAAPKMIAILREAPFQIIYLWMMAAVPFAWRWIY